jgi:hypothetical protein
MFVGKLLRQKGVQSGKKAENQGKKDKNRGRPYFLHI